MTRTILRLSPSGRWLPTTRPLNLQRHPRPAPPPRPTSASSPAAPPRPPTEPFKTLASDTTPVPSIQTVPAAGGTREAKSEAGAVEVPEVGEGAGKDNKGGKKMFLGVEVPVKPHPPAEGECCMSGCAHCIYDLYLEDLEHFHEVLASSRQKALDQVKNLREGGQLVPTGEWPKEWGSLEEEGKEKEVDPKEKAKEELERTRQDLDPTMRAFLEMEARMKAKQKEKAG
ncbi:hypothetical protein JCM8547_001481 [Rhodosporidiobolus lusitaniae]